MKGGHDAMSESKVKLPMLLINLKEHFNNNNNNNNNNSRTCTIYMYTYILLYNL